MATCQQGQGAAPGTEAGWVGVCATLCLAHGKSLGWRGFGNCPEGRERQEEQLGGSRLLIPAQEAQSLAAHSNRPSPPYAAGAKDLLLEPPTAQGKALPPQRDSGHLVNLIYTLR